MLGTTLQETRVYQEAKEEGREEEARSLILRQLQRKCGVLSPEQVQQVSTLSLERTEELGEALLDFGAIADLETWLNSVEISGLSRD
jgi:predicted transposase YdaD